MPVARHVAIVLCAAIAVVAGRAEAASPRHPDIIWGVNGHPLVSYPGVPIEAQLDAVRDLGMRSYRVDIGSTSHIPGLQDLVREARIRGIIVLPVVTPDFDLDKESPESLEKMAYGLAFALVSSFKGQIPVWELGNELENYAIIKPCEMQDDGKQYNCAFGPAGGVTSLEYYGPRWAKVSAVLKGLTRGAHAADPSVRRAVGTAGWGHLGAFERMQADGIEWDISVWHMYGDDPEWAFKKLAKYKKPIWVTEFNHSEGSTKGKDTQAQGLTRAISLLSDLQGTYGVEAAHIYELMDEPYWQGFEGQMGLIEMKKDASGAWGRGETKPAYAAVKELIKRIDVAPPREVALQRHCEPQAAAAGETLLARTAIAYAYCLTLGRVPDGAGAASWSAQLAGGMPIERILVGLMESDEFSRLYDVPLLSTREYVSFMHRLLLDAGPSEPLLMQAAAKLDAGEPRADFLAQIIDSKQFKERHPTLFIKLAPNVQAAVVPTDSAKPEVQRNCDLGILHRPLEFERGQVIYSYCLVLGRWPDGLGLATWTVNRRNGLTLEDFLVGLLQSDEFNQKYRTGELDNAGFVTLLYRLFLNRDPDGDGLTRYMAMLATGKMSRWDASQSVFASDEFHKKHDALFSARMPKRTRAQLEQ